MVPWGGGCFLCNCIVWMSDLNFTKKKKWNKSIKLHKHCRLRCVPVSFDVTCERALARRNWRKWSGREGGEEWWRNGTQWFTTPVRPSLFWKFGWNMLLKEATCYENYFFGRDMERSGFRLSLASTRTIFYVTIFICSCRWVLLWQICLLKSGRVSFYVRQKLSHEKLFV